MIWKDPSIATAGGTCVAIGAMTSARPLSSTTAARMESAEASAYGFSRLMISLTWSLDGETHERDVTARASICLITVPTWYLSTVLIHTFIILYTKQHETQIYIRDKISAILRSLCHQSSHQIERIDVRPCDAPLPAMHHARQACEACRNSFPDAVMQTIGSESPH